MIQILLSSDCDAMIVNWRTMKLISKIVLILYFSRNDSVGFYGLIQCCLHFFFLKFVELIHVTNIRACIHLHICHTIIYYADKLFQNLSWSIKQNVLFQSIPPV